MSSHLFFKKAEGYNPSYLLKLFSKPHCFQSKAFRNLYFIKAMDKTFQRTGDHSVYSHSLRVWYHYFQLNSNDYFPTQAVLSPTLLNIFLLLHDVGKVIDYSLHSYFSSKIVRLLFKQTIPTRLLENLCINHLLFGFLSEGIFLYQNSLKEQKKIERLSHFQSYAVLGAEDLLVLCKTREVLKFLLFNFMPADIRAVNPTFDLAAYIQFANTIWDDVEQVPLPLKNLYFSFQDPSTYFLFVVWVKPTQTGYDIFLFQHKIGVAERVKKKWAFEIKDENLKFIVPILKLQWSQWKRQKKV